MILQSKCGAVPGNGSYVLIKINMRMPLFLHFVNGEIYNLVCAIYGINYGKHINLAENISVDYLKMLIFVVVNRLSAPIAVRASGFSIIHNLKGIADKNQ